MKDDRPRALAVLIAVFLIGILIGAAGSYLWLKPSANMGRPMDGKILPPPDNPYPEPPEFNLTSEQKQKLEEIWKETGQKMGSLMQEQRKLEDDGFKKREAIMAENDQKVRAVLNNEEQKAMFDSWIEEVREWRKRSPRRMGQETSKENRRKPERQGR